MSLFAPAVVEQSAAKVGLFGLQGAGKTLTQFLLAIGLSKTYHNNAPIAMMDTDNGSDYLAEIALIEGVPFIVFKSRAFVDMREGAIEAEARGACAYLVDSYTHPWRELNDALRTKLSVKKLEFRHMDMLKTMWQTWTDLMLNSPLHILMAGRLGYDWDKEEDDETGRRTELVKQGTKMKSENEAGYEPSLLIEVEGVQTERVRQQKSRTKKGSIQHNLYVVKDRWRTLNGRTFSYPDCNGYKAGDFMKVFKDLRPHFDKLAIGVKQRAVDTSRTSVTLFDKDGDSAYAQRARRVRVTLEEIEGTLVDLWPGQDAVCKQQKRRAVEVLFNTKSWTKVECMRLEELEVGLDALRAMEQAIKTAQVGAGIVDADADAAAARAQVLSALTDADVMATLLTDSKQAVAADTRARLQLVDGIAS